SPLGGRYALCVKSKLGGPLSKSSKLAQFCSELVGFEIIDRVAGKTYGNMGATIINGILQSGVKYKTVVAPRVKQYLDNYPLVKTTSDFLKLLESNEIENIIEWKPGAKPNRIKKLANFFQSQSVETESDLFLWFQSPENGSLFLQQDGIGCKTRDYFKILSGHADETAIDRHLYEFIEMAGIECSGYEEASSIIKGASKFLNLDVSVLDHSIWYFMSERA
ncbi:TPA: hypothetical protein ACGF9Q_003625, partial [Vibrio cholerae]